MKELLFTEFISLQWKSFSIMIFTGFSIRILYKSIRKYVIGNIEPVALCVFLELLFFLTAALFTGGIIDYCCSSKITAYMAAGFLIGLWGAGIEL